MATTATPAARLTALFRKGTNLKSSEVEELVNEAETTVDWESPETSALITAALTAPWTSEEGATLPSVPHLLVSAALSSEERYAIHVLRAIVRQLLPPQESETAEKEKVTEKEKATEGTLLPTAVLATEALLELIRLSPLCRSRLVGLLSTTFPSQLVATPYQFGSWTANLLHLSAALQQPYPEQHLSLWKLLLSRLLETDAELARTTELEGSEWLVEKQQGMATRLDAALCYVFPFVAEMVRENGEATLHLFLDNMGRLFLSSARSNHMAHLLVLLAQEGPAERVEDWLWAQATTTECEKLSGLRLRQTALCFLADLIARTSVVPKARAAKWLSLFCSMARKHIDANEDLNEASLTHGLFYALTHAAFFVLSFRHKDIVSNADDLRWVKGLELERIVHSGLRPLRQTPMAVAVSFVSVARRYQLVWCELSGLSPGVDHSSGAGVPQDSAFPLEPYWLSESGQLVPGRVEAEKDWALDGMVDLGSLVSMQGLSKPRRKRQDSSMRMSFCDEADLADPTPKTITDDPHLLDFIL